MIKKSTARVAKKSIIKPSCYVEINHKPKSGQIEPILKGQKSKTLYALFLLFLITIAEEFGFPENNKPNLLILH